MEAKFRVWNVDEMISLNEAFDSGVVIIQNSKFCKTKQLELAYESTYLMQYTGKCDKNKKEIYCSDIVKTKYYGIKVVSKNLMQCAIDGFYNVDANDLEIIGNIYENPELVKEIK